MSAGKILRALLQKKGIVAAPGAMNALTARIIETQGFPAIYLGGNAMGLHLGAGQPFVTLTETVDCARQILAALLDNALRHTPSGGLVTVTCHSRDGRAEAEVRDSGPGIPPEHLPRRSP